MRESIFFHKIHWKNIKSSVLLQKRNGNQIFVVSVISMVTRCHFSAEDWLEWESFPLVYTVIIRMISRLMQVLQGQNLKGKKERKFLSPSATSYVKNNSSNNSKVNRLISPILRSLMKRRGLTRSQSHRTRRMSSRGWVLTRWPETCRGWPDRCCRQASLCLTLWSPTCQPPTLALWRGPAMTSWQPLVPWRGWLGTREMW